MKGDATGCVLRPVLPVDASKCACGQGSTPDPAGGAYSTPPDPLAGFGGMEKATGREGERKGTEQEKWRGVKIRGQFA